MFFVAEKVAHCLEKLSLAMVRVDKLDLQGQAELPGQQLIICDQEKVYCFDLSDRG